MQWAKALSFAAMHAKPSAACACAPPPPPSPPQVKEQSQPALALNRHASLDGRPAALSAEPAVRNTTSAAAGLLFGRPTGGSMYSGSGLALQDFLECYPSQVRRAAERGRCLLVLRGQGLPPSLAPTPRHATLPPSTRPPPSPPPPHTSKHTAATPTFCHHCS